MNESLQALSDLFERALAAIYPGAAPREVAAQDPGLQWHSFRVQPLDMEIGIGLETDEAAAHDVIGRQLATALGEHTGLKITLDSGKLVEPSCPGDCLAFAMAGDRRIVLAVEPGFVKTVAMLSKSIALPDNGNTKAASGSPIEALLDMELPLSICFGRARMSLEQALELRDGSTLDLTVPSDSLVDVMVNDRLVARGEIVVADGNYAVRIKEVFSRPVTVDTSAATATEPSAVGGVR
jgi:flagellar motor switch protein FliN